MSVYACCEENRIAHALNHPSINGIRFLEVVDHEGQPPAERQRRLLVNFLRPINPPLTAADFRVEGGERVVNIEVVEVNPTGADNVVDILVDRAGDFSLYTLRLVDGDAETPAGYDPRLTSVEFSFKINCLKDFDCVDDIPGFQLLLPEPDISYLAKDFSSFRRLMLDRMAVTLPRWQQRNPADFGMAMVEMLAYVGDQLSAFQDHIGSEPYLATARSRVSVRRHARLVDYAMHDGCNARTWVFLQAGSAVEVPRKTQIFTYVPGIPTSIAAGTSDGQTSYQMALSNRPIIFEIMAETAIFPEHNSLPFYTWGDEECCLVAGSTGAALLGHFPNLAIGDFVLLEEIRGARTGALPDADPSHRHVVRLTNVRQTVDPIGGVFTEGFGDTDPVPVTEIEWDVRDALPFPLCLSSSSHPQIAVARGNIVLADHGLTISEEDLGDAPAPRLLMPVEGDRCETAEVQAVPARFRPRLLERPLTQATPYLAPLLSVDGAEVPQYVADLNAGSIPAPLAEALPRTNSPLPPGVVTQRSGAAWLVTVGGQRVLITLEGSALVVYSDLPFAAELLRQDPKHTVPQISLFEVTTLISDGSHEIEEWTPGRDLLNANPTTHRFVVEVENDQGAYLRFGDDTYGVRPRPNPNPDDQVKSFLATYRVGNGKAGNIGAETLAHLVSPGAETIPVTFVRNPLPARGGTEPESIEQVRQNAPVSFRTQERAVTPEDYAEISTRHPLVQRAVAVFRWVGSWYAVFITVDPVSGVRFTAELENELRTFIEPFRMAGHDVEFNEPKYVSLEIEMFVCVASGHSQRRVREELLRLFSCDLLPDGGRGVFHADNFTFGQTVYLSPLYAAARTVEGIERLEIRVFQRQDQPGTDAKDAGKLVLKGREVARLDNDPNHPTHGVFRLEMEGGR